MQAAVQAPARCRRKCCPVSPGWYGHGFLHRKALGGATFPFAGVVVPLLGNHEEMLLAALEGQSELRYWLKLGGTEALASYGY